MSNINLDHNEVNWNKWYTITIVVNVLFVLLIYFFYSSIN